MKIGSYVKCISDIIDVPEIKVPTKNRIYTIRDIEEIKGIVTSILLVEIINTEMETDDEWPEPEISFSVSDFKEIEFDINENNMVDELLEGIEIHRVKQY